MLTLMAMQCNKRKEDLLLSNLDYGVLHKFETPIISPPKFLQELLKNLEK